MEMIQFKAGYIKSDVKYQVNNMQFGSEEEKAKYMQEALLTFDKIDTNRNDRLDLDEISYYYQEIESENENMSNQNENKDKNFQNDKTIGILSTVGYCVALISIPFIAKFAYKKLNIPYNFEQTGLYQAYDIIKSIVKMPFKIIKNLLKK